MYYKTRTMIKLKEQLKFNSSSHTRFIIMKSSTLVVSAIAILVLFLVSEPVAAITCSDVVKDLSSCIKYLGNGVGSPTAACCTGASNLAASTSTSADKKIACNCLKSTAQKINVNDAAAKALPGSCGITLPFPVSASVDCTKLV